MSSIYLAVIFVCGCGLGILVLGQYPAGLEPFSGYLLLMLACGAGLCAFFGKQDKRMLQASLLVAFCLLGLGRTLLSHPPTNTDDLSYYNAVEDSPNRRFVTGVVSAEPVRGDRSQQLKIAAESVSREGGGAILPVSGLLLAILPPYPEYSFGERVILEGELTTPPVLGDFDYAGWLARQGVYSYMSFPHVTSLGRATEGGLDEFIAAARERARDIIRHEVAEPQAALAIGVIVGDRSALSDDIVDAFRRTGTTHILAISGQNITALVGVIWLAWSGKEKRRMMPLWLLVIILALLVFYTAFTGASAAVVRAAIMGAIVLIAPLVRRRYDPMAALALAAAGMVLLDPDAIVDAGFQLSFLAMWGLVIFAPLLTAWMEKARVPGVIAYPVAAGLSAQLATTPLLVVISGQVSVVSLLATISAGITLIYLMMAGMVTVLLGLVGLGALAWISGMLTWLCAWWMLMVVEWWASFSWAAFPIEGIDASYAFACYAAMFAGVWLFSEAKRRTRITSLWPQFRVALLGATAAAVWTVAIMMVINK